jgi:hypothetical protein
MDPRTGLGPLPGLPDLQLPADDAAHRRLHRADREEILETPDVAERVALYREHAVLAKDQIRRCAKVRGNASCSTCATSRSSTPPTAS